MLVCHLTGINERGVAVNRVAGDDGAGAVRAVIAQYSYQYQEQQ